jgi:hypothetical protein
MFALTDDQLATVMSVAAAVWPEKRDAFLQRVAAMLKLKGRFDDHDVAKAAELAACGLIMQSTNAA